MFRRNNQITEPASLVKIPAPFEVFRGNLSVAEALANGSGLPGDFAVIRNDYAGDVRGPLTDFTPGDDLSTFDIINSVAENRIFVPSYKTKDLIPKLWGVVDVPERTVNTETSPTVFDLGRFCADSCVYIATKIGADKDVTMAFDESYQVMPRSKMKPGEEIILTRKGKARLVPNPDTVIKPIVSNNPLNDSLDRVARNIGSDDVCVVMSDFVDSTLEDFDSLRRIQTIIKDRLWIIRPTADSQTSIIPDGASNLTSADFLILQKRASAVLNAREQQLAEIASRSKVHDVNLHTDDPFRDFARLIMK